MLSFRLIKPLCMAKRAFDILVSFVGFVLLLPVFIIVAVLLKLDSPGPVFFLQERIGKNGIPFKLIKFRSMYVNSHKHAAITIGARDSRITRAGYWLRKFKVDEMPQLINVLLGDMSMVGPRPEVKKFVDLYDELQRQVISVKPGITDYASIQFRNENELLEGKTDPINFYITEIMPVKLKLNLDYIKNQSLWGDIKILFQTVFSIFRQ